MASLILSCPVETISCILQNCDDFVDAIALALTCKHIHSVWSSDKGIIAWHVGMSSIIYFDTALMAVRATQMVKEALEAGQLPPMISIPPLSGHVRRPSPTELLKVLDVQHLARCIYYMFTHESNEEISWGDASWESGFPTDPIALKHWQENFYRAIYRILLVGAVLARAYYEPLFLAAKEGPPGFLEGFIESYKEYQWPEITTSETGFLNRFPVYNPTDRDGHELVFGPFVDWFIQDSMARPIQEEASAYKHRPGRPGSIRLNPVQEVLFQDLSRLLSMYAQLGNQQGGFFVTGKEDFTEWPLAKRLVEGRIKTRKTSVFIFGEFVLQEIWMPATAENAVHTRLFAKPLFDMNNGSNLSLPLMLRVYVPDIIANIHDNYDRSVRHARIEPELPVQLFVFAFRKHLNMRFEDRTFHSNLRWQPYREVYTNGHVFLAHNLAGYRLIDPFTCLIDPNNPVVATWK